MKSKNILIALGVIILICSFALSGYNILTDSEAKQQSEQIAEELDKEIAENTEPTEEQPIYMLYPDIPMPTTNKDGYDYIGVLKIKALDLSLPVMSEWSYDGLYKAPGRYSGSAYTDDMVIAAHNYRSHFGRLRMLQAGDKVSFKDVDGNKFKYRVLGLEIIPSDQAGQMVRGEWDLTLFTCDWSRANRITIRCERVD